MPGPPTLSRRSLLRLGGGALAGGLSGCQSAGSGDDDLTSTSQESSTETTTSPDTATERTTTTTTPRTTTTTFEPTEATCESPPRRRVELLDTADVPTESNLSVTTEMLREQVDADGPARLRITITNDGATRGINVQDEGECNLFDQERGGSEPPGLWLYHEEEGALGMGDCWTSPVGTDVRQYRLYTCVTPEVSAGEYITSVFRVWDDALVEGYYPPGTYRFSSPIGVWAPADDPNEDDATWALDWWVDLRVTDAPGNPALYSETSRTLRNH